MTKWVTKLLAMAHFVVCKLMICISYLSTKRICTAVVFICVKFFTKNYYTVFFLIE